MNAIVDEWVAAYRAGLVRLVEEHPEFSRDWRQTLAKQGANAASPEGGECLKAWAKASFAPTGEKVDEYTAKLGRAIVIGIRKTNRDVYGKGADLDPAELEKAEPVPAPAPLKVAPAVEAARRWAEQAGKVEPVPADRPGAVPGKAIHRPTRAVMAGAVERYCAWADKHTIMPADTVLGHFTGMSPATWATARGKAEERGYKFERVGSHDTLVMKVVARPEPVGTGLTAEETAQLKVLLGKLGGRNG